MEALGLKAAELVARNREARLENLLGDSYCVLKSVYRVATYFGVNNFPRPEVFSKELKAKYGALDGVINTNKWLPTMSFFLDPLGIRIKAIYVMPPTVDNYKIDVPEKEKEKLIPIATAGTAVGVRDPHIVILHKAGVDAHAVGIVKNMDNKWIGSGEVKRYVNAGYDNICTITFGKEEVSGKSKAQSQFKEIR